MNIIERAVIPLAADTQVIKENEYLIFLPFARGDLPGIVIFDKEYFDIADGILRLAKDYALTGDLIAEVEALEELIAAEEQARKKAIDEEKSTREQALAGKLDIPTGTNHLWGTDATGKLLYLTWAQSASARTLAYRTPSGTIRTKAAVNAEESIHLLMNI